MEHKLKMELEALPEPETTFEALEAMSHRPKPLRRQKKTALLIAVVLALLLCGMGWSKMQYGMWYLIGSREFSDLENVAEQYHIVLPEALDGSPFYIYNIYGLVPRGAPLAVAMVNPSYRPRTVSYAVEVLEKTYYASGQVAGETTRMVNELDLSFGTTKNELWRYYFQMDENGKWTACDVPESYHTIEYKGITLQVGDTFFYDSVQGCNRYTRWVHWVDEEKQVAFSINESDYTDPNRVEECAKAIIDLNS